MTTSSLLEMDGVRFSWGGRQPFSLAIDHFAMERGEQVLLAGPSGGGKSTFLSLIAGIVTPQAGTIRLLDADVAKLRGASRDRFRAGHMGIIFQMFNLLPYGSVLDNILLPLSFAKVRRERAGKLTSIEHEAARLLDRLGVEKSLIHSQAGLLSVGQQQRVACARALIGQPELIIADEPTSSLDQGNRHAFLDLLFSEVEAAQSTLLMVSHDESLAHRFKRVVRFETIARASRELAA